MHLTKDSLCDKLSNAMVDNMGIKDIERYNRLMDIYGSLLSEKARLILEDYLVYGLSITEIADQRGISKQSVSTTIRRSLRKLESYEEALKLLWLSEELSKRCPEVTDMWLDMVGRRSDV